MQRALGLLLCVALLMAGLMRFERVRCGETRCGSVPTACCCTAKDGTLTTEACHCSDSTPKPQQPAPAPRGEPRGDASGTQPEATGTPVTTPAPETSKGHPRPAPRAVVRAAARPRQIELRTLLI